MKVNQGSRTSRNGFPLQILLESQTISTIQLMQRKLDRQNSGVCDVSSLVLQAHQMHEIASSTNHGHSFILPGPSTPKQQHSRNADVRRQHFQWFRFFIFSFQGNQIYGIAIIIEKKSRKNILCTLWLLFGCGEVHLSVHKLWSSVYVGIHLFIHANNCFLISLLYKYHQPLDK